MDTGLIIFLAIGLVAGIIIYFISRKKSEPKEPFQPVEKPKPKIKIFQGEANPSQKSRKQAITNATKTRSYYTITDLDLGVTVYNLYPDSKVKGGNNWIGLINSGNEIKAVRINPKGEIIGV